MEVHFGTVIVETRRDVVAPPEHVLGMQRLMYVSEEVDQEHQCFFVIDFAAIRVT